MDERKQIGLIYQYNEKWIGGTYYILNIIKALKFLPESEQPLLTIYHDQLTDVSAVNNINYPQIKFVKFSNEFNLPAKLINKISTTLTGTEFFTIKLPGRSIKNFYYRSFSLSNKNLDNYYCWIADLQDLCLPQYFKKKELSKRLKIYKQLVKQKEPIVFSSKAAMADFDRFFPENSNVKKVINFVSLPDTDFAELDIDILKNKFAIKKDYFIVSNQFWKHKNHQVVLESFAKIFEESTDFQLVLTGKEYDYRNPYYAQSLKDFVNKNNLTDEILFLGFIGRDEQLKLMSESIGIIQPSLFEGWSTVVEDARLLNKNIICSDIPVHREQLPDSDLFFDPQSVSSLIAVIKNVVNKNYTYNANYNHERAILKFAKEFVNIFNHGK